jgi:hypothetical protein
MAHINELMGAGIPWRLARMLGNNRLQTVYAAGSSEADATQLAINFALLATTAPGQGVALDQATGAAVTALYNTGPNPVPIYPAPGDAFNSLAVDLPVTLSPGLTFLAVPAVDAWLVVTGGGIGEAPTDGRMYGRQGGAWVAVPPPGTPPPAVTITAGGTANVLPGVGRVFVNAGAAVTVVLPNNDCLVMDRGPQAGSFPITVQAPAGTTIDGNPSYVLVTNWASARFVYDGANFGVG